MSNQLATDYRATYRHWIEVSLPSLAETMIGSLGSTIASPASFWTTCFKVIGLIT